MLSTLDSVVEPKASSIGWRVLAGDPILWRGVGILSSEPSSTVYEISALNEVVTVHSMKVYGGVWV